MRGGPGGEHRKVRGHVLAGRQPRRDRRPCAGGPRTHARCAASSRKLAERTQQRAFDDERHEADRGSRGRRTARSAGRRRSAARSPRPSARSRPARRARRVLRRAAEARARGRCRSARRGPEVLAEVGEQERAPAARRLGIAAHHLQPRALDLLAALVLLAGGVEGLWQRSAPLHRTPLRRSSRRRPRSVRRASARVTARELSRTEPASAEGSVSPLAPASTRATPASAFADTGRAVRWRA